MDQNERVEILKEVVNYLPVLIETAKEVSKELKGEKEEDTKELFNQVIDGINWALGMYYEVEPTIKDDSYTIQKDELENSIQQFAKAIELKIEENIAETMEEGMLPFLREFHNIAVEELKS